MTPTFTRIDTASAPLFCWTQGVPVDERAQAQLQRVGGMPFVTPFVAVMPDVHAGRGATVGSVIPTRGAVIPAAVGVDLGCGMTAIRTSLTASQLPDSLRALRLAIEASIPHGRTNHGGRGDRGAWNTPPDDVQMAWNTELKERFDVIATKHPRATQANHVGHLGTLGTGNHFIELCLDESNQIWILVHSGSRGIGNRIGSYFIELAKQDMKRYFIHLPDEDLAYLPEGSPHFRDYVEAVAWAQDYAAMNRKLISTRTVQVLQRLEGVPEFTLDERVVDCHHNYVTRESHFGESLIVTRKGAIRARTGDLGIIPGSMGAKSFIVRGKGEAFSLTSASHGAGRLMSRTEAKRQFTVDDHASSTTGVECRKDSGVLDETPGAYKDIDAVMAAQTALVEVLHELKQIVCIKG